MKRVVSLLGIMFLVVSLVVIAAAAVMSFFQDGPESGRLIIQIVIAICAAVIGVMHLVIAAILAKRS